MTSPASARCEATISTSGNPFGPAGGNGTLSISLARECSWRVVSPVSWITFTSTVEGQGDGSVSYRVGENTDPVARTATLAVADRQVGVAQSPAPCRYEVTAEADALASGAGGTGIQLRTHPACSWTARAEQPFASVSPASGSGPARITVTAAANTAADERLILVVVAGEQVSLVQRGATPSPLPAPAPTPPTPTPPAPTPPTPTPPAPTPPAPTPPTPTPPAPTPPAPTPPTPTPPAPTPPAPTPPTPTPPAPTPPTPTPPAPTPPTPTPPAPTPPAPTPPTPTPPTPPAPTPPSPTPPAPTPPAPTPPQPVGPVTLTGTVSGVSGSCGTATFTLNGRTVYVTSETQFNRGPCQRLANGEVVTVEGTAMTDGRVRADRIRFE